MESNFSRSAALAALALAFTGAAAADGKRPVPPVNVVLVGWDGAQRAHMRELYDAGELPNLKALAAEGSFALTSVTTGSTQTKPGWAEILTGYSAPAMGIKDNAFYRPIPAGYTIFERLKERFGRGLKTVFICGKINNLGDRGPHEICLNCQHRDISAGRAKTFWWDREKITTSKTFDGRPMNWVKREGEPYFNARRALDYYATGLGPADKVTAAALAALKKYRKKPFFAFIHFEEPDEQGHLYGENSAEYGAAMKAADRRLGEILERLRSLGIYDKTVVYVTSDHGMDEGGYEHFKAPYMFLAANSGRKLQDGDRKDVALTLLAEYGVDAAGLAPAPDGKSLAVK